MMKALPDGENIRLLSPISANVASAAGCRRMISAARSSSVVLGQAVAPGSRRNNCHRPKPRPVIATAISARMERGASPSKVNCHHSWLAYATSR